MKLCPAGRVTCRRRPFPCSHTMLHTTDKSFVCVFSFSFHLSLFVVIKLKKAFTGRKWYQHCDVAYDVPLLFLTEA